MEANQQYALYDGEECGMKKWVAHVRLTPELLQQLQQNPHAVTIQLQAPNGGSERNTRTNKSATKLSSVLSIRDIRDGTTVAEPERYEMLSFTEDPKVNVACGFRPDPSALAMTPGGDGNTNAPATGYSLYEIGRVHQKLIVQRMLDLTEKDRMKDKHAKSVLESKSRASKFLPTREEAATAAPMTSRSISVTLKRKTAVMVAQPSRAVHPEKHNDVQAGPMKRRRYPSALTAEASQELQERIARAGARSTDDVEMDDAEAATALMSSSVEVARSKSGLFSSDSEADKDKSSPERRTRVRSSEEDGKQQDPVEVSEPKVAKNARKKKAAKEVAAVSVRRHVEAAEPLANSLEQGESQPYSAEMTTPADDQVVAPAQPPVPVPVLETPSMSASHAPPIIPRSSAEPKKRARPRLGRLPDLSFLPANVQEICKRVSTHITRTAVLDANDYESFSLEHDRLRDEWEQLDKAYTIESILIDGAHFQLPFTTTEEEKHALRESIANSDKKKEGLAFVRDTMSMMHKILASLQGSISVYEQRMPGSVE